MENIEQIDQSGSDKLRELGLIHTYPLHIDVLNNETGFALYLNIPYEFQDDGHPLANDNDSEWAVGVHYTDYDPNSPPVYSSREFWMDRDMDSYLQIREVDEVGNPGEWHLAPLTWANLSVNTNPPATLDKSGFDNFDAVTWFEGLETGKDYQVQLWHDTNENGRLDTQGYWERDIYIQTTPQEDGTISTRAMLRDYYFWQEPDLYSGIHTINTDPDAFNVDIDADGTMDFFIDADGTMDFFVEGNDHLDGQIRGAHLEGGADDDRLHGNAGNDRLNGYEGDDYLEGNAGDDLLLGGPGDDSLIGNEGDDRLEGGAGDDVFVFYRRGGNDTIEDFGNGSDTIDLAAFAEISDVDNLTITQSGSNTLIDLSAHRGGTITLQAFTGALDDSDFIFAA